MKNTLLFIIIALNTLWARADGVTPKLTIYNQFKPAIIQLADGRKLKQPLANIFLKNSNLLYVSGSITKEANLSTIVSVDFDDRHYVKIDTLLAWQVDTVGNNALYCASVIDLPAYYALLRNNKQLTNLEISTMVQTATIDLEDEEDIHFPVVDLYFYRINGTFVKAHERNLQRLLNKEERRMLKTFVTEPSFSWTDPKSLMRLLRSITTH